MKRLALDLMVPEPNGPLDGVCVILVNPNTEEKRCYYIDKTDFDKTTKFWSEMLPEAAKEVYKA